MLVRNIIIKYDIFDSDIYNFNEIGFFMGMLNYAKVVITSNCKNKFCIKQFGNYNGFQSFKLFVRMVMCYFCM